MSNWDKATLHADADGKRHDEYIWITAYYNSYISDLLSLNIRLRNILIGYGIAESDSIVDFFRIEMESISNFSISGTSSHKSDGKYKYSYDSNEMGDPFGESRNISDFRITHSDGLNLINAKPSRDGSFVISYGSGHGADRDERWKKEIDGKEIWLTDSDSFFQVAIRISGFYKAVLGDPVDDELADRVVTDIVQLLYDPSATYHIVVHCGNELNYCDGSIFSTDNASPSRMGIKEESDNWRWHWLLPTEREKVIFGLYWGLYLSSSHLEPLGGRSIFMKKVREYYSNSDIAKIHFTNLGEGLFVRMTPSPLDLSTEFSSPRFDSIAPWIYPHLMAAGLLACPTI